MSHKLVIPAPRSLWGAHPGHARSRGRKLALVLLKPRPTVQPNRPYPDTCLQASFLLQPRIMFVKRLSTPFHIFRVISTCLHWQRVCASGDHAASGESRGTARPPHGGMFAPLVYYQLRLDVKRMPLTLSTSDEQTRKAQGMAHSPSLTKYGIGPVPNATGYMSADG